MQYPRLEVRKFTADVAWLALSAVVQTLLSLVTVPILTKTYNTELYGIWTQILVSMGFISPLLVMGLDISYIRFLAGERDKEKIRIALGTILWPIFIAGSSLFILSLFIKEKLSLILFGNPSYTLIVLLTFLWILIQLLYTISFCYYKALRKIRKVATIQILCVIVQTAAMAFIGLNGFDFHYIVVVNIIVQGLFTVGTLGFIFAEIGLPIPKVQGLKRYFGLGLPLLPTAFLLTIINSIDRYFITHFIGVSKTGIYSASYSLASLCSFFMAPIAYNVFYTISELWEKGEQPKVKFYFEYSFKLFLTLSLPAAIGVTLLSQPTLKLITTSEFLAGPEIVILIALGSIFFGIYQINVYIVLLLKQTKWLPLMMAISAATDILLNIILIPRIGILGAAIANIVSYFALAVIVSVWARKSVNYNIDFKYLIKVVIAAGIMAVCLWFIKADNILSITFSILLGIVVFGSLLFIQLKAKALKNRLFHILKR